MSQSYTLIAFAYVVVAVAFGLAYVFAPNRIAKFITLVLVVLALTALGHASKMWVLP